MCVCFSFSYLISSPLYLDREECQTSSKFAEASGRSLVWGADVPGRGTMFALCAEGPKFGPQHLHLKVLK